MKNRGLITSVVGLALVLGYWLALQPNSPGLLGYSGDLGTIELTRQITADHLLAEGKPGFFSDRLMYPTGMPVAFFSWAMERDWLGAWAWIWNRDFSWLWVYFGLSLLVEYVGIGLMLERIMNGRKGAAWSLATLVTVFNVPRHYKTYHHYEHLIYHWVYLGFFLDAWIWKEAQERGRLSWAREAWRVLLLQLTFGLGGYTWGPVILEWAIVRLLLLWQAVRRRGSLKFEPFGRGVILPTALGLMLLVLQLRWFLPLWEEVRHVGPVASGIAWSANFLQFFRPIWLDPAGTWIRYSIDSNETVVTLGWVYWLPVGWAMFALKTPKARLKPFLVFVVLAIMYASGSAFLLIQRIVQAVVPFMGFFRVTSRMGLFLVPAAGVLLALVWPELETFYRERIAPRAPRASQLLRAVVGLFAISTLAEFSILAVPVNRAPAPSVGFLQMMTDLRHGPGSAVLDMPFCVAGGNGYCTQEECPGYPDSVSAQVLTGWHSKKVHGIYLARLTQEQCGIYWKQPYFDWFKAWRENRCLDDTQLNAFCEHLRQHPEYGAVLVYPGLWPAIDEPVCRARFESRLGRPIREESFVTNVERGYTHVRSTTIRRYAGSCQ